MKKINQSADPKNEISGNFTHSYQEVNCVNLKFLKKTMNRSDHDITMIVTFDTI